MQISSKLQKRVDSLRNCVEELLSEYSGVEITSIEYEENQYHDDGVRVTFNLKFWNDELEHYLVFEIVEEKCYFEEMGEDNWEEFYIDDDSEAVFTYDEQAIVWRYLFFQALE